MFDLSFSELMLIGVVALIVIGPERLPKVARTVGHLVGRAQRYVSGVKSDIQREINLSELNNIKGQMEDAAKSMQQSMQETTSSLREPLDEARQAIGSLPSSIQGNDNNPASTASAPTEPTPAPVSATGKPAASTPAPSAGNEPATPASTQQNNKAGS